MVCGSRLMAKVSWLMAQSSWLMAHGQGGRPGLGAQGLAGPGPGPSRAPPGPRCRARRLCHAMAGPPAGGAVPGTCSVGLDGAGRVPTFRPVAGLPPLRYTPLLTSALRDCRVGTGVSLALDKLLRAFLAVRTVPSERQRAIHALLRFALIPSKALIWTATLKLASAA